MDNPLRLFFFVITPVLYFSMMLSPNALGQTAPTPDTTFSANSGNLWRTSGNWDNGVPTGTPSTQTGDNALIGDNQTALWEQNVDGDPAFGTLTLGENSTLQYRANGNQGLPLESNVYFKNGSVLQYTSGSSNRNDNFFILPGASATFRTAGSTFMRGTLQGAGNLDVIASGNIEIRKDTANYTGNLTFTNANSTGRRITLSRFGGGSQRLGSGVNTIGSNLYLNADRAEKIPNSATLRLVGGPGANNQAKYRITGGSETIANLVIESPTQSGPYLITGNNTNSTAVRVTDTVTFEGTANTIEIQSRMGGEFRGEARLSGVDINANNMVFRGTGEWTIDGSKNTGSSSQPQNFAIGSIGIEGGGDVTTLANVTVNAAFNADNGFTKKGAGTLTLNHTDPLRNVQNGTQDFNVKGTVTVEEGTLILNNTVQATINVGINGALGGSGTINSTTTIAGVHAPGTSPGIQSFGANLNYSSGSSVQWELNANATATRGTNFDGINVAGDLVFSSGPTSLELAFDDATGAVDWTDSFWETSHTETDGWLIYDVDGNLVNPENLAISLENWEDSNGALFDDELAGSTFSLFQDGSDIYLEFNAGAGEVIPEPSSVALLGASCLLLLRRRR
ncbi:MAG: PEP-CTERM sorting domain-containing protein [Akkermansiaceae bacterium]